MDDVASAIGVCIHHFMEVSQRIPYGKISIASLAAAVLVVMLPFVGWLSVSPLLPPDYLVSIPRVLSIELFLRSLMSGLLISATATLLIGLPALYRIGKARKVSVKDYFMEISLWTAVWSVVAGLLCGFAFQSFLVLLISAAAVFFALCIPSYLAGIMYWYFAARDGPSNGILLLLVLLFFIWNVMSANFASLAATD